MGQVNQTLGANYYRAGSLSAILNLLYSSSSTSSSGQVERGPSPGSPVVPGMIAGLDAVPVLAQGMTHSGLPGAPTKSPDSQFYASPTHIMGNTGGQITNLRPEVCICASARAARII